jgi:Fe-S-cluster containining protein
MVHALADRVVDAAVNTVAEQGQQISCKKGCGACCRQLVPIAEVEARQLRDLVEDLPEPRRSLIRTRFADARRRLAGAGLLEKLLAPETWDEGDGRLLGLSYFRLGIACPFLQEESCSIYADRPSACREYLVTSPAENCARPTPETVQCVKMPLKVWTALARFDEVPPTARFIRWVPLILALEWAETHPEEPPPRPGPELLRELFEHLSRKARPLSEPAPTPFAQEPNQEGPPPA